MDEDKKNKEIGLFRYAMIAPVIQENVSVQAEYFREISKKEYEVPHIGKRRFKVATLKAWLRRYRKGGFEGLQPKTRNDKGRSRKIDSRVSELIKQTVQQYPLLSSSAIHRLLIAEGHIGIGEITEATVRKYIRDNMLKEEIPAIARKKYEKEHVNELWIGDCMHGPYIICGKKKCKTYLISAIDDHSRVVVGGRFFFHENSICLESVLKDAIRRFGLPEVFYCDNGSLFSSSHLQLACARLGIALVHSRPYDSPSRGKIERFFRTVKQKFLPMLKLSEIEDIEHLNNLFERWLSEEYNKHPHSGINEKPMDRFMEDIKETVIKRISEEQLDTAFQITIYRKVKNDSTVSIGGLLYECPTKFVGKKIQIRYPSDKPEELLIYEQDKPIFSLKKLNIHENAYPPYRGITFTNKENQDDDRDIL